MKLRIWLGIWPSRRCWATALTTGSRPERQNHTGGFDVGPGGFPGQLQSAGCDRRIYLAQRLFRAAGHLQRRSDGARRRSGTDYRGQTRPD